MYDILIKYEGCGFVSLNLTYRRCGQNMNLKDENVWIRIGGLIVIFSIFHPILLLLINSVFPSFSNIGNLGPVGDFIGGTTVGFLSLASIVFVVVAIIMQKKELEMQRDDLALQRDELKKTREEFELSNQTLLKQQFENTFFNMINLHHNILNNLELDHSSEVKTGRNVFTYLYEEMKNNYNKCKPDYLEDICREFMKNDNAKMYDITLSLYWINQKRYYFLKNCIYYPDPIKEKEFKDSIINEKNTQWIDEKQDRLEKFKSMIEKADAFKVFSEIAAIYINQGIPEEFFCDQDKDTLSFLYCVKNTYYKSPFFIHKLRIYEEMYSENQSIIGHYYRNLYRIFKFIQDQNFSSDNQKNKEEQSNYRGILRAQLSSIELLMLFYNIAYSEKGEKFKHIISDLNFFDNHLIESEFIWKNDNAVLKEIK